MPSRMARALFQGGGMPMMDDNDIGQLLLGGGQPAPMGGQQPPQQGMPAQQPDSQQALQHPNPFYTHAAGLPQEMHQALSYVGNLANRPKGFAAADRRNTTFGQSPALPPPQIQQNTGQNAQPLQAISRSSLSRRDPSGFNPRG